MKFNLDLSKTYNPLAINIILDQMQEIRDSIKRRHEYIMRRYQPIANIDKKEWDQMF